MAQSDSPIYQDLNTSDGRDELGFDERPTSSWPAPTSFPSACNAGDDASCLNLFQARQPRVFGVPPALVSAAASRGRPPPAKTDAEKKNPWLLNEPNERRRASAMPMPGRADRDGRSHGHLQRCISTASAAQMKLTGGDNRTFTAQVVGLLQNSVLQGNVLMSEAALQKHFPDSAATGSS